MNSATLTAHFRNHKTYGGFEIADKSLFNIVCRASFIVAVTISIFHYRSVISFKAHSFPNKLSFGVF